MTEENNSTELATLPEEESMTRLERQMDQIRQILRMVKGSELLSPNFKTDHDLALAMMIAMEYGVPPTRAITGGLYVVPGKGGQKSVAFSARIIKSLVLRSGLVQQLSIVERTDKLCTIRAQRKGDPEPTDFTFTAEQAKVAGLATKDNWRAFPATMLEHRATAMACRSIWPDVVEGMYLPDEAEVLVEATVVEPEKPPEKSPAQKMAERLDTRKKR